MSRKEKHPGLAATVRNTTLDNRSRRNVAIDLTDPGNNDRVPTDEEVSKLLEEIGKARPRSVSSLGTK